MSGSSFGKCSGKFCDLSPESRALQRACFICGKEVYDACRVGERFKRVAVQSMSLRGMHELVFLEDC